MLIHTRQGRVSVARGCLLAIFLVGCGGTISPASTPETPTSQTAVPPEPVELYPSTASTLGHTTLEPASTPGFQMLTNPAAGYRLIFPDDWQLRRKVVATEFATTAECQAVEIVDYQPPEGSAALILHSLVQICALPLEYALSLEQFMLQTYGNLTGEPFVQVEFSGHPAYRSRKEGPDTTIFFQTEGYRIQIVSAVAAGPEVFSVRTAQVQAILESFTFAG